MKKVRNSNIEILRIIAMLFIVISHYTVHNGISNASLPLGINRYLLEITSLGNIGVILFILITGYFMIEQKEFKIKKIVALYLQLFFYSVFIFLGFVIFSKQDFSIKAYIQNFMPIIFQKYWFMTCYVFLFVLSPFINKFLNGLKRKEHLNFLLVTIFLFSFIPTFTTFQIYANELIQLITFYSIGAYFKKYPKNIFNNKKLSFRLLIVTILLLLLSVAVCDIMSVKYSFFNRYTTHLFNRNSIIAILFCVSLFNTFINKKEFNNKLINKIGGCTLGVYLIHDNYLIRDLLWNKIFKNYNFVESKYLILHMVITILIVYIVCTIIEYIRKNTVEKLTNKIIISKIDNLQKYLESKYNYILKKYINIKGK